MILKTTFFFFLHCIRHLAGQNPRSVSVVRLLGGWIPWVLVGGVSWDGWHRGNARPVVCIAFGDGDSPDRTSVAYIVWVGRGRWRRNGALVWVNTRRWRPVPHYRHVGGRWWGGHGHGAILFKITAAVGIRPVLLVVIHDAVWVPLVVREPPHREGWYRAADRAIVSVHCFAAVHPSHVRVPESAYAVTWMHPIFDCAFIACAPPVPRHAAVTGAPGKTMYGGVGAAVLRIATEVGGETFAVSTRSIVAIGRRLGPVSVLAVLV